MNRRSFISTLATGAAISITGCGKSAENTTPSTSETPTKSRTQSPSRTPNPYGKDTLTVAVTQQTAARHDMFPLVTESLSYWEAHSERFAGYPIQYSLQPNHSSPDILIRVQDTIESCGSHSANINGCAPLVTDSPSLPVTVRIATGRGKHWLKRDITHELGHTLGLTHQSEPAHIMSNSIDDRITNYSAKTNALQKYHTANTTRQTAIASWETAKTTWNTSDNTQKTTQKLQSARSDFTTTQELVDSAQSIADRNNHPAAVTLLSESSNHITAYRSAVTTALQLVTESPSVQTSTNSLQTSIQDSLANAHSYTFHRPKTIQRVFGLPPNYQSE